MKKLTVTVGIPAYNEAKNIKRLLLSVLSQRQDTFNLVKIVILSDGSSDNTISEAQSLQDSRIVIRSLKKRKGKSNALNIINSMASSDVIIHLDADILIRNKSLFENLMEPIRFGADLTSARVMEYWTKNKFEAVLKISMLMKKEIFESYKQGNNIYTCHGRARALTKRLYKSIYFQPDIVAEDAFVYLYTVANNFVYSFAKKANVHYRLPGTLPDHQKQSVRFFQSYNQLRKEFGAKIIRTETRLPKRFVTPVLSKYVVKYPLTLILYLSILIAMRIRALFINELRSTWTVAKSSKGAFGN